MKEENNENYFSGFPFSMEVLKAIERKGFKSPTPVQSMILPRLLSEEKNIAVKARTGTGKTAAFGIPLVNKLNYRTEKPQALILAPTRELALQISQELASLTLSRFPRITAVYGGASIGVQLRELERGAEIVVGTPGRVQDHIDRGSLDLSEIQWLILDEADEMLDMGFIEDVKAIIDRANPDKKVALFSATLPAPIMKIVNEQLGETEILAEDVPDKEEILVDQDAIFVHAEDRLEALKRIIDSTDKFHGLVFCPTKLEADEVARKLTEDGYPAEALHGNLSQEARERTLRRFKSKITTVLIATDVAARGIDVERLTHVVNWDLPRNFESYVHRIGRTGRAGEKGTAISFIRPSIRYKLREFARKSEAALGSTINVVKVPEVNSILEVRCRRLENTLEATAQEIDRTKEDIVSIYAQKLIYSMGAEKTVIAMLRTAYGDIFDTERYREIKQIDEPKRSRREKDRDKDRDRRKKGSGKEKDFRDRDFRDRDWERDREWDRDFRDRGKDDKGKKRYKRENDGNKTARLHILLGREDQVGPKELVRFLEKLLKIKGNVIDDIAIKGKFSFATVPEEAAKEAVKKSKRDPGLPTIMIAQKKKKK